MGSMREAWTDERLDDMSDRMDRGFDRVDAELRALNGRFDALQLTMIQAVVVLTTGILAGFAGLIAAQL